MSSLNKLYKDVLFENNIYSNFLSVGDYSRVRNSKLGYMVEINRYNFITDSKIGDYTYTGENTTIRFAEVGKFCSISWKVSIGGVNHDYNKISTHPFTIYSKFGLIKEQSQWGNFDNRCIIGNDVWIGSDSTILRNVKVGNGAIIAAGSVVTKDVQPYEIVGGVPAKHIKYRFSKEIIALLQELKWWDWSKEQLKKNIDLFKKDIVLRDLEVLVEKYK